MCNSVTDAKLARNSGSLDVLVGSDLANLHPKSIVSVGKLNIMRSSFGTGWTLMGHNKEVVKVTGKQHGVRANVCAVERIQVSKILLSE